MPAIVIGDHRHRRVADLRLAGELCLRHIGHADHVALPRAVELAFGEGGKLRPLHDEIGAAALQRHADPGPGSDERVADPAADWVRHRHMRDTARSEETLRSRESAVDELIDDDKIAGLEVLAQAADGGER